jgi:hypothetical protein
VYNGGPVLTKPVHIYEIWLGDWSKATTRASLIDTFLRGIGGSQYLSVLDGYHDANGVPATQQVEVAGATEVAAPDNLSQDSLPQLLNQLRSNGALPDDPQGFYLFLGAAGVTMPGFMTAWCGYHDFVGSGPSARYFGFVGDASGSLLQNCAGQVAASPNGDPAGDAMLSVIAHELLETITDPELSAWYANQLNSDEIGDRCVWNFTGTPARLENGSFANVDWVYDGQTYYYYLQQEWGLEPEQGCVIGSLTPSAIGGFTAVVTSPSTFQISWTAPLEDGGSPVAYYNLRASYDGGVTWVLWSDFANGGATSYTWWQGGTGATSVTIEVDASNAAGFGVWSAPVSITLPGYGS